MKKILLPLLCLTLIFSSCQEDDPSPSSAPSSSSSLCGSASVNFDGTNYTLNNPAMQLPGECQVMSNVFETNGNISSIAVSLTNMKSNNYEVDWILNLSVGTLGGGGNVTITGTSSNLGFGVNLGFGPQGTNFQQYTSLSSPNGQITITNINNPNNTIDGNFSCTVYHSTNSTPQLISGSFSDIPLLEL
tara:strand:+ start:357 stop:923 length:567 start_codon:yes stop_codon:yes gene_type:complete